MARKYYETLDEGKDVLPVDKRLEPENLVRLAEEALTKANEFGLQRRELFFAERYLNHWNERRAAEEAGYHANAGQILLAKTCVRSYIDYRLIQFQMSTTKLLAVMSEALTASMDPFVTDAGVVDLAKAKREGKLHLVKSLNVTLKGITISLVDSQTPMRILAEYYGLVKKRPSDKDPGEPPPNQFVEETALAILQAHRKADESRKVREAEDAETVE